MVYTGPVQLHFSSLYAAVCQTMLTLYFHSRILSNIIIWRQYVTFFTFFSFFVMLQNLRWSGKLVTTHILRKFHPLNFSIQIAQRLRGRSPREKFTTDNYLTGKYRCGHFSCRQFHPIYFTHKNVSPRINSHWQFPLCDFPAGVTTVNNSSADISTTLPWGFSSNNSPACWCL